MTGKGRSAVVRYMLNIRGISHKSEKERDE